MPDDEIHDIDPEVKQQLAELAAMHDEWVLKHAAAAQPKPHAADDYGVHHVDVDPPEGADDEYFRRAREIMGYDPDTGDYRG
ncbi:hypothetical protein [Cryptosporangium sp. NPDC051539]|uniref:hypothetical protein n=1 Tax=Cryptosporangium sp. NPDC051539 TaxID=3363962 RepID=UPI0037ADB58C